MKNQLNTYNLEDIKLLSKEQLISLVVDLFQKYSNAEARIQILLMRAFSRKSEANLNPNQGSLFTDEELGELASMLAHPEAETTDKAKPAVSETQSSKTEKKHRGRKVINPDLPRVERVIDLEDKKCKTCAVEMTEIGADISEKYNIIPASLNVISTKRIKYACLCCKTLTAAPTPAEIIDKGLATAALLAEVVSKKYLYHLPLYRQRQLFLAMGADISLSTLVDWVASVGDAFTPLAERLKDRMLSQRVIHADETRLDILNTKKHQSLTHGYIWAYATSLHSDTPIIFYACEDSRSGQHAQNMLSHFKGTLVVDDFSGYKALFDKQSDIKEAGCFTHVRRKFAEIVKVNMSSPAQYFINESAKLYHIEEKLKHMTAGQRRRARLKVAEPILNRLKAWLETTLAKTLPGTVLAKALNHALKRWPALNTYLNDGNVPIDNNHIERSIRPIALGRKNWLFAGSLEAGKRITNIISLLATAKANGIDPEKWLLETLTVLPTWKQKDIDMLLPLKSVQQLKNDTNHPTKTSSEETSVDSTIIVDK